MNSIGDWVKNHLVILKIVLLTFFLPLTCIPLLPSFCHECLESSNLIFVSLAVLTLSLIVVSLVRVWEIPVVNFLALLLFLGMMHYFGNIFSPLAAENKSIGIAFPAVIVCSLLMANILSQRIIKKT